jgi:hypothetical protein
MVLSLSSCSVHNFEEVTYKAPLPMLRQRHCDIALLQLLLQIKNSSTLRSQAIKMLAPITFTRFGFEPDLRLYVFNKEFHVDSEILKLYSSHFRSLLDPSSTHNTSSTSPDFHSDWYTSIGFYDQKSSWSLSPDTFVRPFGQPSLILHIFICSHVQFERMLTILKQLKDMDLSRFIGDVFREEKAFQNLLCAMFGELYSITDAAELNSMIAQAETHKTLPILSTSISGTFPYSPGLISAIEKDPCSLLVSAHKLRHKVLFQECYIHALGPQSHPRYYHQLSDEVLRDFIEKKRGLLGTQVLRAYNTIVRLASGLIWPISDAIDPKQFLNFAPDCVFGNDILYPKFFRLCYEHIVNNYDNGQVYCLFSQLLENKLALNKDAVAGVGDFADFFLCCELKDDELPWDVTQTNW